jgi:GTP-binding protein
MQHIQRADIRNIAIIAHVDHGKTTLVDGLLKQSKVFGAHQHVGTLIMDSNDLEREKGITILAKNTAVHYLGIKINIIDTPGHADFSGEVERVLTMADGCLLLVDAVDGPMPQTTFVLRKALSFGLKPIVVINKIDRANARPREVLRMTQDLFLELATHEDQLDFPVLYAVAKQGIAVTDPDDYVPPIPGTEKPTDRGQDDSRGLAPLFDAIVKYVPPPMVDPVGPLQVLITSLGYDNYQGKTAIGRVIRGTLHQGDPVAVISRDGTISRTKVTALFTFQGLERIPAESVAAGDILSLVGLPDLTIGDTVASVDEPEALPTINIEEPTVRMSFGVNTSPFAGRDGQWVTSRHIRERLYREIERDVALRVADTPSADVYSVSGRGELHLAILIETMRREGYEFQVSRPEVITKTVEGQVHEPVEHLVIDTREEHVGYCTEVLSRRLGQMVNMHNDGSGNVRLEFAIPTRGLIGFRSDFLTATRGSGMLSSLLLGYEPWYGPMEGDRNGVLVASEGGTAVAFGISKAQERGGMFIEPGTPVYEGMIVGLNARDSDIAVNVCREKQQSNMRQSTAEIAVKLVTPMKMSLEQALDFIGADELVEVTPKTIRLRKRILENNERVKFSRRAAQASALAVEA